MSRFSDKVTDSLIPQSVRPYWTFRSMTAVVLFATVASAFVRAFVRFRPEQVARLEGPSMFHSPLFLSLYYAFAAFVMWLIYATRHREGWYLWRVTVFGMFLAGLWSDSSTSSCRYALPNRWREIAISLTIPAGDVRFGIGCENA